MTFSKQHILLVIATALIACVVAATWLSQTKSEPAPNPALRNFVIEAFEAGRFEDVVEASRSLIAKHQNDFELIKIAATAAERMSDNPKAIELLELLPPDFENQICLAGWLQKSKLLIGLGRLTEARDVLETIIQSNDDDVASKIELATLLCGAGQAIEGNRMWRQVLTSGQINVDGLVALAKNGKLLFNKTRLERYYKLTSADPLVVAGMLEIAWKSRDVADVEWLLKQTTSTTWQIEKHRLRLAITRGEVDFTLPADISDASDSQRIEYQLLMAQQVRQRANQEQAIAELKHCLLKDPWNLEAAFAVTEILRASTDPLADQFKKMTAALIAIESLCDSAAFELNQESNQLAECRALVAELLKIGRTEEAKQWSRLALRQSQPDWARRVIADSFTDDTSTFQHPAKLLPMESANEINREAYATDTTTTGQFHFADISSQVGMNFSYDNGSIPQQEGLFMHQWTGGGVAVFDLDHDEWPDLYFAQGGELSPSNLLTDQVLRNRRGKVFESATQQAGIHETEFGQGVAAGDVNGDGFADIYVGNAGVNRLLINQGDGTFIAESIGDHKWTTSVAIADVTNDGTPDLYDVNYLKGDGVFSMTCDHDGRQRICGPTDFPAESDVLHRGNGDRQFTAIEVPDENKDGRGMGVVIGDLTEASANQVYVANDESANRLLRFDNAGRLAEDTGFQSGVALSDTGHAQGSMGIAVGDADRNGTPDLFVTNYYSESNNLFRQVHSGVFIEDSKRAGLSAPGFAMLGFGCQFLDADGDGFPELVVANGHLDDFTHQGKPYRMKPQLFANRGDKFIESQPSGNYFDRPLLGRSLAKLDWNKDGQQDFVVTHLNDSASLVENQTPQQTRSIEFRLIGVRSCRDAIGSHLHQKSQPANFDWVTAGDGYQTCNERVLRLKWPETADQHAEWQIQWRTPDQNSTTVSTKASRGNSGSWAIVEGRPVAYELPR